MTSEPASPSAGARRFSWRLGAGATGISAFAILTVTALGTTSQTLFRGAAFMAALALLGSYWVVKPWFVSRSETWHRMITFAPMTAYMLALGLVALAAASLLPDQPVNRPGFDDPAGVGSP